MADEGKKLVAFAERVAKWKRVDAWPDWIITGGESGPGARPYVLAWARELIWARDAVRRKYGSLKDPKGGNLEEWPEDLRMREWPSRGREGRRG